jgi:phosphoglycolate phosphatase
VLRALLFDFNGVLVDDEPRQLELFLRVLAEEGVTPREADLPRFLGRDDRSCFTDALLADGREATAERVARLVARRKSYYQEAVRREGYAFFPGALELVREAAAGGLMLGVVSGAPAEEVEGALRQAGVRTTFKAVVTADDVDAGKPRPDGYRAAMGQLNSRPPLPERLLHPHEVLAVEDSPPGLAAARAAGLVTLAVAHSCPAEALEADAVVEALAGLTLARLQALYAEASRA